MAEIGFPDDSRLVSNLNTTVNKKQTNLRIGQNYSCVFYCEFGMYYKTGPVLPARHYILINFNASVNFADGPLKKNETK